jgi:hypothetical protein
MYPLSPTGTLHLHKIKKAEIIFLFIKVYIGIIAYNNAIVREILLHQPGESPTSGEKAKRVSGAPWCS